MRRRVVSGLSGRVVSNYVGLIVLALLVGLMVPLAVAAFVAVRDPMAPSCHAGLATSTSLDGTVTWASGPTLWFADGDLGRARRLVNYAPARPRLQASPGVSPSPSNAEAASPSPVPTPGGSPPPSPGVSPSPPIPTTTIEAAAITPDHALVAFVVSNPPGNPGTVSLLTISPQAPPGTAPALGYSTDWHPELRQRSEVVALAPNRFLFTIPARYELPQTAQRVVGVVEVADTPKLVESASEDDFLTKQHGVWPETKDYRLPASLPHLSYRVIGADGVAAGVDDLVIRTPLTKRTLHAIQVGRTGRAATGVVCATADSLVTAALSPDEHRVAAVVGDSTYVLDLAGGRGLAFLCTGRVLDWRS